MVTVMDDPHGNITPGDGAEWIALGEAARRLRVTRAAIYGRIERKTLTTRPKGNRGLEVLWPPSQHHPDHHGDIAPNGHDDVTLALAAGLRERLERAEGEAVQLRGQVVDLRVELAKAQAQVEAARAVAIADVATAQVEVQAKDAVIVAKDEQIVDLRARLDRAEARLALTWWRRLFGGG